MAKEKSEASSHPKKRKTHSKPEKAALSGKRTEKALAQIRSQQESKKDS